MYIKEFTIYGFGQWIDQTISLDQSFTCIYGRNESGKTTIQQFILFMLFGLPPRKRKFHTPKTSSRLGGRLTMVDSDIGEYVIERQDGQNNGSAICYTKDGKTYDEQWLQKRLKGYTKNTYEAVYSFAADDLVDLSLMDPKEMSQVILSMGLTGSEKIHQIERNMYHRLTNLFRPHGKNPTINKQLTKLEKLHVRKTKELKTSVSYEQKRKQKISIKRSIEQLRTKQQQLTDQYELLTKQKRALPYIEELVRVEERLKDTPRDITFPEKGLERFEQLKEKKIPLQSEWNIVNNDRKEYNQTIKTINNQLLDPSLLAKGEEIVKNFSIYQERQDQIEREKTRINEMNKRIINQIDQLQINLDQISIENIDFSFQTKPTWQQLKNEAEQIRIALDHHRVAKKKIEENQQTIDIKLKKITEQLMSDEQLFNLHEQADAQEQQLLLTKTNKRQLHNTQFEVKKLNQRKRRIVISTVIVTSLLAVIAFIYNHSILYLGSLISLLIGFSYIYITNETIHHFKEIIYDLKNDQVDGKTSNKYHYILHQIDQAHKLQQKYDTLVNEQRSVQIDLMKWQEKQKTLLNRRQQIVARMNLEIEQFPFLKSIDVAYWIDLYYEIQRIKESQQELLERKQKLKQLKEQNKIFEQSIDQLLCKLNKFSDSLSYQERYKKIDQMVREQNSLKQTLTQSKTVKDNLIKTAQNLKTKLKTIDESIDKLFASAGVTDEDQYYEQASLVEQLKTATESKKKIHQQLTMIFGTNEWQSYIPKTLVADSINEEQVIIDQKITEINHTLDDKRQQQAELKAQMKQIEHSNAYSETFHQFSMEQNELEKMAKEWAVLKTAEQMLKQAKHTYQQKYLDDVLEQTSYFFKRITAGRYDLIIMDEEDDQLIIQSEDLIQYKITELSKGTIDQLYISLRLAMSQIVNQTVTLPFLIDDAWVHSDHERQKRMIDILQELSKTQQVILFTCHPENIATLKPDNIRHLDHKNSLS